MKEIMYRIYPAIQFDGDVNDRRFVIALMNYKSEYHGYVAPPQVRSGHYYIGVGVLADDGQVVFLDAIGLNLARPVEGRIPILSTLWNTVEGEVRDEPLPCFPERSNIEKLYRKALFDRGSSRTVKEANTAELKPLEYDAYEINFTEFQEITKEFKKLKMQRKNDKFTKSYVDINVYEWVEEDQLLRNTYFETILVKTVEDLVSDQNRYEKSIFVFDEGVRFSDTIYGKPIEVDQVKLQFSGKAVSMPSDNKNFFAIDAQYQLKGIEGYNKGNYRVPKFPAYHLFTLLTDAVAYQNVPCMTFFLFLQIEFEQLAFLKSKGRPGLTYVDDIKYAKMTIKRIADPLLDKIDQCLKDEAEGEINYQDEVSAQEALKQALANKDNPNIISCFGALKTIQARRALQIFLQFRQILEDIDNHDVTAFAQSCKEVDQSLAKLYGYLDKFYTKQGAIRFDGSSKQLPSLDMETLGDENLEFNYLSSNCYHWAVNFLKRALPDLNLHRYEGQRSNRLPHMLMHMSGKVSEPLIMTARKPNNNVQENRYYCHMAAAKLLYANLKDYNDTSYKVWYSIYQRLRTDIQQFSSQAVSKPKPLSDYLQEIGDRHSLASRNKRIYDALEKLALQEKFLDEYYTACDDLAKNLKMLPQVFELAFGDFFRAADELVKAEPEKLIIINSVIKNLSKLCQEPANETVLKDIQQNLARVSYKSLGWQRFEISIGALIGVILGAAAYAALPGPVAVLYGALALGALLASVGVMMTAPAATVNDHESDFHNQGTHIIRTVSCSA